MTAPTLTQYYKDYRNLHAQGFHNTVSVTKLEDDKDFYEVSDVNGGVSQGMLQTVTLNGKSEFQKIGEWTTNLPNGHTLIKTYGNGGMNNYRENMYNKKGIPQKGLAMFDYNLVSREERNETGDFIAKWHYMDGKKSHFDANGKITKNDYMNCRKTTFTENLKELVQPLLDVFSKRVVVMKNG